MFVKIERSFARLTKDSGAEKLELLSYRIGFVSPVDKKEAYYKWNVKAIDFNDFKSICVYVLLFS